MKFPTANLSIHISHQPEFLFKNKTSAFSPQFWSTTLFFSKTNDQGGELFFAPGHSCQKQKRLGNREQPPPINFKKKSRTCAAIIPADFDKAAFQKKKRDEALEPSSESWGWDLPPSEDAIRGKVWRFGQNLGVPGSLQVTVMWNPGADDCILAGGVDPLENPQA